MVPYQDEISIILVKILYTTLVAFHSSKEFSVRNQSWIQHFNEDGYFNLIRYQRPHGKESTKVQTAQKQEKKEETEKMKRSPDDRHT